MNQSQVIITSLVIFLEYLFVFLYYQVYEEGYYVVVYATAYHAIFLKETTMFLVHSCTRVSACVCVCGGGGVHNDNREIYLLIPFHKSVIHPLTHSFFH